MREDALWLWMQDLFGIATSTAHKALVTFGSPTALLELTGSELAKYPFITEAMRCAILKPELTSFLEQLKKAEALGVRFIPYGSEDYPESLTQIFSPPLYLFCQGDVAVLNRTYPIAMVGARKSDAYGHAVAKKLAGEIAQAGGTVISGMALGIDGACHTAALEAGGETVAVLGCGLDVDYPMLHAKLRQQIIRQGAVICEQPFETPPRGANFPPRNRIISGMSLGVVLVRCALKSGTLHTATHALAQGRDVFAVPGDIFSPLSQGCNQMLFEGAIPAMDGGELMRGYIERYGYPVRTLHKKEKVEKATPTPTPTPTPTQIPLNEAQRAILAGLQRGESSCELLANALSLPAQQVMALLTELELYGLAAAQAGGQFKAL